LILFAAGAVRQHRNALSDGRRHGERTELDLQDLRDRDARRRIAYIDACGRCVVAATPLLRAIIVAVTIVIGLRGVIIIL
jgi:hypothetical protein